MAKRGRATIEAIAAPIDVETYGFVERPAECVPLGRGDYFAAGLAAIVAMLAYLRTLPPTITGEDCGEFVTAAYTLGIAHPPGYPLFCMLGKLFTIILPFGTVAWRVAFMTSFFGAATCFVVCLIIIKLARHCLQDLPDATVRICAVAAAAALAVSREFWKQNVVVETYSLNAFLMTLGMLLLLTWYETRNKRLLYAFAVTFGLGLCNHHTTHFLGPIYALFILSVDRRPWFRWQTYLWMAGIALGIWVVIHAYLPLRAMTNPPNNWGNPSNWENFWDVVMRQQYTFGFTKDPRTPDRFLGQSGVFLNRYLWEFTPWLLWLPFLGIYPLWKRHRRALGLTFGTFLYVVLGFILVINFDLDKESIWVNTKFWIPAYVMASVLLGVGLAWLASLKVGQLQMKWLAIPFGIAVFVCPLLTHYNASDKSDYYFAYDYAKNLLATMEPNAIYFPTADNATFPVLYLQAVEGMRRDVLIANKYGYPEEAAYKDMPFDLKGQFHKIPTESEGIVIEDWVIANTDRPVYFTKKRPVNNIPGATMVNAGLLYRVSAPKSPAPTDRDYWSEYEWHVDMDGLTSQAKILNKEYSAEHVASEYHFSRGRDYFDKGDIENATREMEVALAIVGESKETLNNVATAFAEYGQLEEAKKYYEKSVALAPDYEMAMQNYAKVCMETGDYAKALSLFQRLIDKQPAADTCMGAVQCLKELRRFDEALDMLEFMAKNEPKNAQLPREMGMIYLHELHQPEMAKTLFTQSLKLDPNQTDLIALMTAPQAPGLAPDLPTPNGGMSGTNEVHRVNEAPTGAPENLVPKPPVPTLDKLSPSPLRSEVANIPWRG